MKKSILTYCFVGLILLLAFVSTSWSKENENDAHHLENPESVVTDHETNDSEVTPREEAYSESDDNSEYVNESEYMQIDSNEPEVNPENEDSGYREEEYAESDDNYESDEMQTDPNEAEVKSEPAENTGDADTWDPGEKY